MTSGIVTVCSFSGLTTVCLVLTAQAAEMEPIEKYGILGLLYVVLVGSGVFLMKIGMDMNKSIQANTAAVQANATSTQSLASEIGKLIQHNTQTAANIQSQMTGHTDRAISTFERGIERIEDRLRDRGT